MRSSTRSTLLGFVFSLCLMASSVLVTIFLVPPADAQTYIPYWDPDTVEVFESDGEVVLTLKKGGPGHVRYQTEDGGCCTPAARAPDDYAAVSGDLVFTEAGSRTISIPIVDDNLDEGSEAFSVFAHEGDRRAGGWTGHVGTVRILDDDHPNKSSGSSVSSGRSNQQPAGSQTGSPTRPASPPATTPSSSASTVAGNQSGEVNADDPNRVGETGARDEAEPFVGKAASDERRTSSLPIAGAGTLLLVAIAAASRLKTRLHPGRR